MPKPEQRVIWNIYANTENININAKSAEGPKYALTADKNLDAKSAEGLKYALTAKENLDAKSAMIRFK